MLQKSSVFVAEIDQYAIPSDSIPDELIWCNSNSGELTLRDAYSMLFPPAPQTAWGKQLWCPVVPPTRSLLLWRIIHKSLPTDETLWNRGCCVVSSCSLCNNSYETTEHLFFQCLFALQMWSWLSSCLSASFTLDYVFSILSIFNQSPSPQVKDIYMSDIANTFWFIWYSRNQARLRDIKFQSSLL